VLQQTTGFPDEPATTLSVVSGTGLITLRVRVPHWLAAPPTVCLNGAVLDPAVLGPAALGAPFPATKGWIALRRLWRPGDVLAVTLPMQLAFEPTPDKPAVQALTYGPVVLAGVYPADPGSLTPLLDPASVHRTAAAPMTFEALANRHPARLIPVSRAAHKYYTVYWQTT
jgi:uncharacterized protein